MRGKSRNRDPERGYLNPQPTASPQTVRVAPSSEALSLLAELSDRRAYHPEGDFRPAVAFSPNATQLVPAEPRARPRSFRFTDPFSAVPVNVAFRQPAAVAICVRRKTRREVLFANKRTGKGARSRKSRNFFSKVSC